MSKTIPAIAVLLVFGAIEAQAQTITNQPAVANIPNMPGAKTVTPAGTWALPAGDLPDHVDCVMGSFQNGSFVANPALGKITINLQGVMNNGPAQYTTQQSFTVIAQQTDRVMQAQLWRKSKNPFFPAPVMVATNDFAVP